MSRKKYIQNEDLEKDQRSDSLLIDIHDITDDAIEDDLWEYTNGWPQDKFKRLMEKVRTLTPYSVSDDPKFFDLSIYGYSVYNHSFSELCQREGLE